MGNKENQKILARILKRYNVFYDYIKQRKKAIDKRAKLDIGNADDKRGIIFVSPISAFLWRSTIWCDINNEYEHEIAENVQKKKT